MEENSQLIINAAIKKGQLILQKADEKADAIIAEAKAKAASEAERILAKAKQEAEEEALKIIVEAKNRAEKMTFIIRREAEQLVPANCKMAASDVNKFSQSSETHTATLVEPKSVAPVPKPLNCQEKYTNNAKMALYHDIVEIVVSPPVTTKKLFGFLLAMRKIPGIKVLKFKERTDGGFTVKLRLQKAVPLANILSALPEVQKVLQPMSRGQQQNPIAVMLKS
jgi:vacuolar-type H+-ATPase subunit H